MKERRVIKGRLRCSSTRIQFFRENAVRFGKNVASSLWCCSVGLDVELRFKDHNKYRLNTFRYIKVRKVT